MILGPVNLIDCLVFCIFLTPQLLLHVGLFKTIFYAASALPFLLVQLPFELVEERYWTADESRSPFVRSHSFFEDLVIRCVRYAFSNLPTSIGRVFFSEGVALPFLRWRMLRHGYLRSPVHWRKCAAGEGDSTTQGIWVEHMPKQPPDFVVYYVHGGGFAMGSPHFYLEFLLAWHHLLLEAGYANPAIYALKYSLVPDEKYPKQMNQVISGYEHVMGVMKEPSKVCVAGDSAGATLVLSLLLEIGARKDGGKSRGLEPFDDNAGIQDMRPSVLHLPRLAVLISPWVTLQTRTHYPSRIDYLDRDMLWEYAEEYAGEEMIQKLPASPGVCVDSDLWRAASPQRGYFVTYGDEEVFAPDIESFIERQSESRIEMRALKRDHEVHAWPVASLFLSSTEAKRLKGLRAIVSEIRRRSL